VRGVTSCDERCDSEKPSETLEFLSCDRCDWCDALLTWLSHRCTRATGVAVSSCQSAGCLPCGEKLRSGLPDAAGIRRLCVRIPLERDVLGGRRVPDGACAGTLFSGRVRGLAYSVKRSRRVRSQAGQHIACVAASVAHVATELSLPTIDAAVPSPLPGRGALQAYGLRGWRSGRRRRPSLHPRLQSVAPFGAGNASETTPLNRVPSRTWPRNLWHLTQFVGELGIEDGDGSPSSPY